eukprot:TRINITY_DN2164_c0_g2_i1.p1 TRINITY_DN2164_c0_g2~~TRINITY_DN2164_c0_g2_i1.p1  ORF type:complete len:199 (-),score=32.80 TRINITY_DN2164_c0_g2_i1:348-944(-)
MKNPHTQKGGKKIPKLIHQIWLGGKMPERYKKWNESWGKFHPDWQYKLWIDDDVQSFQFAEPVRKLFEDAPTFVEKSDIFRYAILLKFGGIYVDTDFECLQPFDVLHEQSGLEVYAGISNTGTIELNIGIIGAVPNHDLIKLCLHSIKPSTGHPISAESILERTGPYHFTRIFMSYINENNATVVGFPVTFSIHSQIR